MVNVEQHELEMVEAMTKETLGEPPVLLDGDSLLFMEPFPHEMRPGKSERQKGQEFSNAFVMLEMTRLEVEAAGLQSGEKRFDLPSLGVQRQSMVGFGVGGDNQIVALQFDADEGKPVAIDPAALGKYVSLADMKVGEAAFGVTGSAFGADERVVLDADVKGQASSFEVSKPACADELSVGNYGKDALFFHQLEKALDKDLPFLTVRVARLTQEVPDDGKGYAPIGYRQHQDVDGEAPQLPVTAVDRDHQPLLLRQERQHQPRELLGVEAEAGEEALDAAVVGVRRNMGVQHQGKLAEGHGADPDECQGKGRCKGESGSVPGKLGLKDIEESFSLLHKADSNLGVGLRNPIQPSPGPAFLCFVVYLRED
jgi:hypothetical protein